ncbi:MAG: flagellar basal-body rod protein FlgF [Phenylobacterium sp.]|uniref:flagellar basal-body rod protein FlgF n=1 Tax=Phenylobacterium sp. TaxID=1871053 RepID=UPI002736E49E|nr:flagellar basal-body rod protein FlgF [Phenylobacterium sp.]MDP3174682.1 flagellar basal-body rod protein FlgF [Phenylobacterium sp.]
MDNALYVGLSRQMLLRRELDITANNIANMDTTGFKVESLMAKTEPRAPAVTAQGPRPVKFVMAHGVARDFTQGSLRQTGGSFDLAIEGKGFFKISTADGERYTRDGRFMLDDRGRIVTQQGDALLDEGGGEIVVDPQKGLMTIAADGAMSQGAERVGKVGAVSFDELSVLEKVGDNLLKNNSNLQPQAATDAKVRQGMLEASNVKPVIEMNRLIEISRAYESITRMMENEAELSRRSVERMGRIQ